MKLVNFVALVHAATPPRPAPVGGPWCPLWLSTPQSATLIETSKASLVSARAPRSSSARSSRSSSGAGPWACGRVSTSTLSARDSSRSISSRDHPPPPPPAACKYTDPRLGLDSVPTLNSSQSMVDLSSRLIFLQDTRCAHVPLSTIEASLSQDRARVEQSAGNLGNI